MLAALRSRDPEAAAAAGRRLAELADGADLTDGLDLAHRTDRADPARQTLRQRFAVSIVDFAEAEQAWLAPPVANAEDPAFRAAAPLVAGWLPGRRW